MRTNVKGRVKNTFLPKSQSLLPLYEAIINSIDAIEDAGMEPAEGRIDITILRKSMLPLPPSESEQPSFRDPIWGFEVVDNGIGFTDENYDAFNEADTQVKASRGGKGVGRFIWLKAFQKVEVDSTFKHDGQVAQRTFTFSLASIDGISDHHLELHPDIEYVRTKVCLLGFDEQHEANAPRSPAKIAQHIVEHCLEYFVLGVMPVAILHDQEEETSLHDVYRELVTQSKLVPYHSDFDILLSCGKLWLS
jgi:hypothetical protein